MISNKKIYLGLIYDAMRVLGFKDNQFYINLKPKTEIKDLVFGPALTTKGRKTNKQDDYKKLDNIRLDIYQKKYFKKKPIVVLESNDKYCAHSGDITSLIYQKLGAVAFLTDGNVRDIDQIRKLNFPVFCEGLNPIDALNYWALTEYNVKIKIHGIVINPGDYLFASSDGVIRVEKNIFEEFYKVLESIYNKEKAVKRLIIRNKNKRSYVTDLKNFVKKYDRW